MDEQIQRLANLDIENILIPGDPHFKIDDIRKSLSLLKEGARKLQDYPDYWDELPKAAQTLIVNESRTLMRVIDEITSTKDNTAWLTDHLHERKESINALYERLYPYLVTGVRQYESETDNAKKELQSLVRQAKKTQKSAEEASEQAETAKNLAQESAADTATSNLALFFDRLAHGDDEAHKASRDKYRRIWWLGVLFRSGYKYAAMRWFMLTIIFTVITGIVGYLSFHDFNGQQIEEVLAKALILAAPAYGIKFSAKNFRDNKSLEAANKHRAVVMKTLLSFMSRTSIDDPTKNLIITEAASQAFKNSSFEGSVNPENDTVLEIPAIKLK